MPNLCNKPAVPQILFVTHSSRIAGAELVLLETVAAFSGGAKVFLFEHGPLERRLYQLGAQVITSAGGNFQAIKRDQSLFRALPRMAGLIRVLRQIATAGRASDVVYANSQKAFVLAALGAPSTRRPLVWHLHDILTLAHFGSAQIRLVVFLANCFAASVIVPSTVAAQAFIKAGGRQSLVQVVPNGVSAVARAEARTSLRSRLEFPAGFVVGAFSRLAPWKGQHIVIEALARLPEVSAVIAGDAQFGEHDYAMALRETARRLGVEQRVHFLGHRNDVTDLMQAVDVVVHPSIEAEPFGLTILEAMLSGTPLITTDGGAAREILGTQHETGLMIPPRDPGALANAIERLRNAPDLAARLAEAAKTRAQANFDIETFRRGIVTAVLETTQLGCRRVHRR